MTAPASTLQIVTVEMKLMAIELLDDDALPGQTDRKPLHNRYDIAVALDPTTTPKAEYIAEFPLQAASGSIDLTAIQMSEGVRDLTGFRLVALRIRNTGTNAAFVLSEGATNGYPLGSVVARAPIGGGCEYYFAATLAAVGATDKILDYTGHASDPVQITMIFGTP